MSISIYRFTQSHKLIGGALLALCLTASGAWSAPKTAAKKGAPGATAQGSEEYPSVESLLEKANVSSQNRHEESVYIMRLIGRDGAESVRKMQVWFKGEEGGGGKILIKFMEPANIRGTGFLSIVEKKKDPEQWLYLPSLKRSRRIIGGNSSESFLGSDFSMSDISVEANRLFKFIVTGSVKCGDSDCWNLLGVPRSGKEGEAGYSKKIIHVRKDSTIPVYSEYYDGTGKLAKVMTLNGLRRVEGKPNSWNASSIEMKNVETEHRTVIEYEKRQTDKIPADSIFTQANLERER